MRVCQFHHPPLMTSGIVTESVNDFKFYLQVILMLYCSQLYGSIYNFSGYFIADWRIVALWKEISIAGRNEIKVNEGFLRRFNCTSEERKA